MNTHRNLFGPCAPAIACGVALFLGACNIVGPLGYFVVGPQAIPAVHTLDPTRTTVVFIDDRANQAPTRAIREIIGRVAEDELLSSGVVKDMVQSRRIQSVVASERYGKPLGIAEVGQAVQADVVIYAALDRFTLSEEGQLLSPLAVMRVKVIDSATSQRLFPAPDAQDEYFTLTVRVPEQAGPVPNNSNSRSQAFQDLARWAGRGLAQMFHDQDPTNKPTRLNQ